MDQSSTMSPARSQRLSVRPTQQPLSLLEIQTLLCPLSEQPPSLFEALLALTTKGPIEAEIPECLVQPQGKFFPILLYSEDGTVRKATGSHTFNKFFELVDLRLSSKIQKEKDAMLPGPKYCVRGQNTKWSYYRSREECVSRWNELGQDQYLMCRYVRVISLQPRLYRVAYRDGEIRAFKLGNRERGGRSAERKSIKRVVSRVSIYQHSPADFHYAGKLLRESFSPYLPYPSRLTSKPPASLTSSPSHRPRENKDQENCQFTVNIENPSSCTVTPVGQLKPELTVLIRRFLASVERLPRQAKVEEMVLDCVKIERGRFVIMDCVQLRCGTMSPHENDVHSLRQRFQQLALSESLPKAPRPRVLTPLPAVQPAFARRKLSDIPSTDLPSTQQVPSLMHSHSIAAVNRAAKHLSSVEAKYDGMVSRVRRSLQNSKNLENMLDSLQRHLCEDLLDKVMRKLIENPAVKGVFDRPNREPEAMKRGLLLVLRGEMSLLSFRRMKQLHTDMGVTTPMLKVLETLLRQEAQDLGVPTELLELILTRLVSFFSDFSS